MFKDEKKNTPRNNLVQTLFFVVDKIIRSLSESPIPPGKAWSFPWFIRHTGNKD